MARMVLTDKIRFKIIISNIDKKLLSFKLKIYIKGTSKKSKKKQDPNFAIITKINNIGR